MSPFFVHKTSVIKNSIQQNLTYRELHNRIKNNEYNKTITYTYTNNKVTKESDGQNNILYEYDDFDRIIKITKDSKEITYEYDIYGRLIRENNEFLDKTIVYSYNDIGNIISKKEYSYTTVKDITITPSKTINYTYDTVQKDRLITFDTTTIPYNTLGCPTKYKGYDLTWNKGKLTGLSKGTIDTELESISYTYNAYGQRVSKSQYKRKGFNALKPFPKGELTDYNKERVVSETLSIGLNEVVVKSDFDKVSASLGEHEGIVDIGRNILGVEVSIFIREKEGMALSFGADVIAFDVKYILNKRVNIKIIVLINIPM